MSIKIELNEHSANDVAAINELRKLGFDDEEIQDIYNESYKTCGRCVHDGESGDIVSSTCYLCKRNREMENEIIVTYDRDHGHDLPAVTCFERDDERNNHLSVAYVGESAEELIKIITEQGYLHTLLDNQKKPETGFVNKVCVHFRDGNMEQDCVYMDAIDIVLDNPEYLIFTTNDHKRIYFNKKDVVYFEMEADRG